MIEQVLNRGFVLDQLTDMRAALERGPATPAGVTDTNAQHVSDDDGAPSGEDYTATLEALVEAERAEEAKSSGQVGFDDDSEERRRGETPAPIDDLSYFSRNPILSNVQSAVETYAETHAADLIEIIPDAVVEDRREGETGWAVTDRRLVGVEVRRERDGRRLAGRFEQLDPRWTASLVAMGVRLLRRKHPFKKTAAAPCAIPDRCRFVMVGDWASGLPRACRVAKQMRVEIEKGQRERLEQHVIHLGDVYYSGWAREVKKHLLDPWPVGASELSTIGSWSTNGNHDMYSGGHAYFKTLLADPRFARHEGSSFFSFENRHWRILGLDTAWDDHGLVDPQPEWIREQVAKAKEQHQKVILLSHHQLFSLYDGQGDKLKQALGKLLTGPNLHVWYWGHEHRCVLYLEHERVQYARCLGHGGVPVYQWRRQSDAVASPGSYEFRWAFWKGLERWAYFGFAVLDFDGPEIRVRYIEENGIEHHNEVLR